MKHPPEYYAEKPNLVRLAKEISSSKHPEQLLNALAIILSDSDQGRQAQAPLPEGQTNNERFNTLLNSCQNPRDVYNALSAFSELGDT